jgi:hypothetical protein
MQLTADFGIGLELFIRNLHRYHCADIGKRITDGMGWQSIAKLASKQSGELRYNIPL